MGGFLTPDIALYAAGGGLGLMLLFGIVGAVVARGRSRGAIVWFLLCFLLPLVALIVLLCLPRVRVHPVWAKPVAAPARQPAAVSDESQPPDEREPPTDRPPSGNGELRTGSMVLMPEPIGEMANEAEASMAELQLPPAPSAPVPVPRKTLPAAAPRRGRVPGVPQGYPDFQVLARGETKIEVQCPNCGCVFRRLNSLIGRLEKCPDCHTAMRIPT